MLAVGMLGSSGCGIFRGADYYSPRYPVIPLPDRPQLQNVSGSEMGKMSEDAQKAVAGNMNSLMDYSRKLEIGAREYNEYAEEHNKVFEK
jgi:hypothetical protein